MGTEPTPDRAALVAAFAQFEEVSSALAQSYASLEQQVAGLNAALACSNARLADELAARERLARRLSALLAALPAGVVVLDGQGRVREANAAAVELLGELNPDERWFEVVARVFAPRWDDGHDVSLVDGRRVNVATQALADEPGQILLISDVTETRRLQEQLSHHRRLSAKTEMAAALAHQIRTPLAAALLSLGPVARSSSLPPALQKGAGRALDSLRQLERLVENMLSFARGAVVDAVPVAVADLLARLDEEVRAILPEGRFALDAAAAATPLVVHGNADALLSVMLNLVNNASQIVGQDCRLGVTLVQVGDFLTLRFMDNGPGVPAAEQARIFEPFHTTRAGGTGLGLPVAQAIARAHGGDLALNPAYTGGACFELSLPVSSSPVAAVQVSA